MWRRRIGVFVGLIAGSLCGCTWTPRPTQMPVAGDAMIYVVGRGWHTDIGLPVDAVHGPLAGLEGEFPGVRFMVFGFGERNYLLRRTAGSGEMLTALFPSKSAILVTALEAPPTEAFADEQVVTLRLTQAGVDRVAELIWQALEKTADGSALRLADGPYPGSLFYASSETYDAFHTCNTWTARLLRDSGVPVDPRGVLFVGQVMRQVAAIAAVQARQDE
jgi:uncharacterized protein (TIGR02117 family)